MFNFIIALDKPEPVLIAARISVGKCFPPLILSNLEGSASHGISALWFLFCSVFSELQVAQPRKNNDNKYTIISNQSNSTTYLDKYHTGKTN